MPAFTLVDHEGRVLMDTKQTPTPIESGTDYERYMDRVAREAQAAAIAQSTGARN